MNKVPRLAHLFICILVIADAYLISYATGLNLKTIKLDPGKPTESKLIRSSSYHAPDSRKASSESSARSSAKSASLSTSSASNLEKSHTGTGKSESSNSEKLASASSTSASPASKNQPKPEKISTTSDSFADLEKTEKRLVGSLKAAADAGVLDESKDKLFHPNKPVTRADFTRWMVRIKQLPITTGEENSYLDIKPDNPYFNEIETATRAFMVQGYPIKGSSDKEFKPEQIITRQEFAAMYGTFSGKRARAEKLSPEKIDQYLQYDPDKSRQARFGYKDEGQIDDWARSWVAVAQQAGVLEQAFDCNPGSSKEERRYLHPQKQMTRAESVNILVKLFGLSAKRTVKEFNQSGRSKEGEEK